MDNHKALIDRLVVLLAMDAPADVTEATARQFGVQGSELESAIEEAKTQLAQAGVIDRQTELGVAVVRMRTIYQQATSIKDVRTALTAQRELNRLLGLYKDGEASGATAEVDAAELQDLQSQLTAIAGHLLPLGLVDPDQPLSEHARVAAQLIRRSQREG